jgi:Kef-type K+ transport system membrane component KefB
MNVEHAGSFPVEKFLIVFAIILIASKVIGELTERIKQPPVLGELIAGVLLGGSVFALIPSVSGQSGYETFHLLAELGVVILLFEIGLETDLNDLIKVGVTSTMVAIVGIVAPFVLGFLSIIAFQKYGLLTFANPTTGMLVAITVGATLTATSVGITARVLSDINKIHTPEAKIVLGAAVIDDILGLIILAVVTGLIEASKQGLETGISAVNVLTITLKAFGFLIASIIIGMLVTGKIFNFIQRLKVRGILLLSAISFAFLYAYLAHIAGLAAIVGAFAAGLVLAKTGQAKIIEERLKPVSDLVTPVFFVMVGAAVDITVFNPFNSGNIPILIIAFVLFAVAVAGKFVSGFAVFKEGLNKKAIGIGMIPRGEVGLIFAQLGLAFAVFDIQLFSAVTAMVMLTTFIAPPLLKKAFGSDKELDNK